MSPQAGPLGLTHMKGLQHVRTRRQLFRITAVSAASIPFLALTIKSASAQPPLSPGQNPGQPGQNPGQPGKNGGGSCFLKGTKISTPSGDRLVQDLQIGDEVQTLSGRKTIRWIGYNKFTKEEGRAWHDNVMPIRVARFAIDDRTPRRDLYLSPLNQSRSMGDPAAPEAAAAGRRRGAGEQD